MAQQLLATIHCVSCERHFDLETKAPMQLHCGHTICKEQCVLIFILKVTRNRINTHGKISSWSFAYTRRDICLHIYTQNTIKSTRCILSSIHASHHVAFIETQAHTHTLISCIYISLRQTHTHTLWFFFSFHASGHTLKQKGSSFLLYIHHNAWFLSKREHRQTLILSHSMHIIYALHKKKHKYTISFVYASQFMAFIETITHTNSDFFHCMHQAIHKLRFLFYATSNTLKTMSISFPPHCITVNDFQWI